MSDIRISTKNPVLLGAQSFEDRIYVVLKQKLCDMGSTYPCKAFSPNQSPLPKVLRKTGSSLGESSRVTFTYKEKQGKSVSIAYSGDPMSTT